MDRITYDMLKEVGACSSKLESFAAVFPAGAPISMESVYRAIEGGLDLRFAARLVPDGERAIFDETVTIMEGVYDMAIAPACQRRNEMTGPAWEAYKRIADPAWRRYREAIQPGEAAYQQSMAALRKGYSGTIGPRQTDQGAGTPEAKSIPDGPREVAEKSYREAVAPFLVAVRDDIALAGVDRDTAIDEPTRRCHEVTAAAFRVYLAGFGLALVVALTRGVSDGKEE